MTKRQEGGSIEIKYTLRKMCSIATSQILQNRMLHI